MKAGAERDGFSLHLVTDDRMPFSRLLDIVDDVAAEGVDVVQLRAKSAAGREFVRQARAVADAVAGRALVLVNDRVDVALAARDAGARIDGVHLGQTDLPADTARRLLGPTAVVGLTANTPAHVDEASALAAGTVDYLGVGVIRPTSTKPDHPPALGLDGFASLAARTALPCIAIGGVLDADVPALRLAGAAGVAVVSAICGASDPRAATRAFKAAALVEPQGAAR